MITDDLSKYARFSKSNNKSKRIQHNEEIFYKITAIEKEYLDKIDKSLMELIPKLSPDDIKTVLMMFSLTTLRKECLDIHCYNDKYDREIPPGGALNTYEFCLDDFPNIWNHIKPLYSEGTRKINNLRWRMKPPKSNVI
jgi:hypothetical protein